MRDYDFKHPENRLHKGGIYLFDDRSDIHYPDFHKGDTVFDAKYELLGSYNKMLKVNSDDIHRVMVYMTTLKVDQGGFVAPLNQKQLNTPTSYLKGSSATLSIYGIEISKTDTSYMDFCENMREMGCVFVESSY